MARIYPKMSSQLQELRRSELAWDMLSLWPILAAALGPRELLPPLKKKLLAPVVGVMPTVGVSPGVAVGGTIGVAVGAGC
jgi:hypothetical protein